MITECQYPRDRLGTKIMSGDTIKLEFLNFQHKHVGRKKIVENPMTGEDYIVPDEGGFMPPSLQWVEYLVQWSGACLTARRTNQSNYTALISGKNVSKIDNLDIPSIASKLYLTALFNGSIYEVVR